MTISYKKHVIFLVCFLVVFFLDGQNAFAYVGPGAGFALLTSFLTVLVAFFLAIFSFLSWPFRSLYRLVRGKNAYKKALTRRVVIIGLDGLDPDLAREYIKAGKLPNLGKLAETGTFAPLQTTYPAISPVAWSSFQTGVNPGRHNIFDFLSRDNKTYLPQLSSSRIDSDFRTVKLGRFIIPLGRPVVKMLRKSQPFWKILGAHGIFSTILRVPITFPPEKFYGLLLSGMCVPDLKGSQGTFCFYSTANAAPAAHTGGVRIPVTVTGNQVKTHIHGPNNPVTAAREELLIPVTITLNKNDISIKVDQQKFKLQPGHYSDWIKLTFKAGMGIKIPAIGRFYLKQLAPEFELYLTPLNIDPEKPALPISYPRQYATYLARLQGSFATLGLAEDTWALNEKVLDETAFLQQCYDIFQEREQMFFSALARTDKGLLVCIFDTTDRIQHTFLRFLDPGHPANVAGTGQFTSVIEDLYIRMDNMIGQVMEKIDQKTVLMVVSDHGFKQFKRGINLNTWLHLNGYLHLQACSTGSKDWFADVDWRKTRAYALGLAGIYLNIQGRESNGMVQPGAEAEALQRELIDKLTGLRDEEKDMVAINQVFASSKVLSGPYVENAPDLLVGYNAGYRASWDCVTGQVGPAVFSDNTRSWGADHCIDPRLVPGVLFSNRKLNSEIPAIIDIAPTVLRLFGVKVPEYMDGRSMVAEGFEQNERVGKGIGKGEG